MDLIDHALFCTAGYIQGGFFFCTAGYVPDGFLLSRQIRPGRFLFLYRQIRPGRFLFKRSSPPGKTLSGSEKWCKIRVLHQPLLPRRILNGMPLGFDVLQQPISTRRNHHAFHLLSQMLDLPQGEDLARRPQHFLRTARHQGRESHCAGALRLAEKERSAPEEIFSTPPACSTGRWA